HADLLAQPPPVLGRVEPEHADRAAVAPPQPFDALHRGGLAGAVGAEDAEDLALRHGERHPVQNLQISVRLTQAVDFDDRHGSSLVRRSLPRIDPTAMIGY